MKKLKYMQIDKKELHQRCSFTISMKTDLEHFLFTSQRKIQRNKFVLNMIGNQNNNAFKDWVIVTTDFLFFKFQHKMGK